MNISEKFEISVSELLDAKIEDEPSKSDVAEQLARINEQLAIKNCRAKRICKAQALRVHKNSAGLTESPSQMVL